MAYLICFASISCHLNELINATTSSVAHLLSDLTILVLVSFCHVYGSPTVMSNAGLSGLSVEI